MDLTVIKLRSILEDVPDEAIIGGLDWREEVMRFDYLKRILLLEKDGKKVLLFNSQGTHFFHLVEKEGYKCLRHWDERQQLEGRDLTYPDLSKITDLEKKNLVDKMIGFLAQETLGMFLALGRNDIEVNVLDKNSGKEFKLSFKEIEKQ